MLLKTDINMMKIMGLLLGTGLFASSIHAESLDCSSHHNNNAAMKKICSASLFLLAVFMLNRWTVAVIITITQP